MIRSFVALSLFAAARATAASSPVDDWKLKVDAIVGPLAAGAGHPAVAVGVVAGDRSAVYGYGGADGKTQFEIGSISKVFTSLVLADLVASHRVGLLDPVKKWLPPSVNVPSLGAREITLEDLATHRSGLPRLPDNLRPKAPSDPYADYTVDQLYEFLSRHVLKRVPGAKYEYSNLGATLLGVALERAGGDGYEALIGSRICRPLGMTSTLVRLPPGLALQRFAPGYNAQGVEVPPWHFADSMAGAGGIHSTVNDLVKLAKAHLGLLPSSLDAAIQLAILGRREADGGEIGLGWHLRPDGLVWHNGQTGGYHSYLAFDPANRIAVVLLAAKADPSVDELANAILREFERGELVLHQNGVDQRARRIAPDGGVR